MAINQNTARNAKHTSICCMTGAGKGVAMNTLGLVPSKYPIIIFDPHGEYTKLAGRKVYQYKTRMNFAKVFQKAWASGKPFALAYTPKLTGSNEKERKESLIESAHWFASLAWAAADGNRILYAVFEEFAGYADGNRQDDTIIGKIWKEGRKFGLRAIAIFQRSAEVPKTIWNNSPVKVIGAQGGTTDQDRIIKEIGCKAHDVIDLGNRNVKLSMYAKSLDEMVRTKVHYLVSEAAGTFEKVASYVPQSNYLVKDWTADQKELDKNGGYRVAP
jgi:hypothetical protein